MADYTDHIHQAKRNLDFLKSINSLSSRHYDWEVTVCFYISVHLVNAHLAKSDLHYRSHDEVAFALNPINTVSPTKVPDNIYVAFNQLQKLSRRSRYLVNNKEYEKENTIGSFTHEKHFAKALKHLDILMNYFADQYSISFDKIKLDLPQEIRKADLKFFE